MRLSMWILAIWLKKYDPVIKIQKGNQVLRNVRLLSESPKLETYNVYVGNAQEFIPSGVEGVICVNDKDIILLKADSIGDVFNEVLSAFDYYNDWSDSMREIVEQGCSLQTLIDISENILDYPLLIVGSSHQVLALSSVNSYHGNPHPLYLEINKNRILPLEMITQLNQELHGKQYLQEPYYFNSPLFSFYSLHKNLFYLKEHVGWLIMSLQDYPISEGYLQLFNTFGNIISTWMSYNFTQDKLAPQSELFTHLLAMENIDYSLTLKQLNYIDWFENDVKYILKIMTVTNNERIYHTLKHYIEQTFSGCYIIIYELSIVLIINTQIISMDNMLEEIRPLLNQSKTCCGISYPFHDIRHLKQAYEQAGIALKFGNNQPGDCNFCDDYAVDYAKSVLQEHLNINIKHWALEQLLHYDTKHHTNYYETLQYFLLYERNQIKTAEVMNIHRNTLVYRINRINEIIQIDLNDLNTRNHIMLSYFLED